MKKFIAHKGEKYTIEWYFDARGRSSALEYFQDLPLRRKKKLIHLLYVLGVIGKIFNKEKFRYEGDQVYVIKPSPDRFLCFFYDGAKIIITNAYVKKIAKMPIKEKKKALKSKADYMKRYKGGTYYE